MDIGSLDDFFAVYTTHEKLGKAQYLRALGESDPDLLTETVSGAWSGSADDNITRDCDYDAPLIIHRHERYVHVSYHDHSFLEIMYQYKGLCSHSIEGRSRILHQGDLCFISPGVFHLPEIYDDSILLNILIRPEIFHRIYASLEGTEGLLAEYLRKLYYQDHCPKYLFCHPGEDERLSGLLDSLIRDYFENKKYRNYMMQSQLMTILFYLLREHDGDCIAAPEEVTKSDKVLPILQYIHDHYREISLAELSEVFSYTEQHICRLIKARTGQTFNQHLMDLRLNQAKLLLITTDLSFQEIAWYCGYSGSSYFHRAFTAAEKMTPIQYRKRARGFGA